MREEEAATEDDEGDRRQRPANGPHQDTRGMEVRRSLEIPDKDSFSCQCCGSNFPGILKLITLPLLTSRCLGVYQPNYNPRCI